MFCAESIRNIFFKRQFTKFLLESSYVLLPIFPPKWTRYNLLEIVVFGCSAKCERLQNDWWNDSPQTVLTKQVFYCVCVILSHISITFVWACVHAGESKSVPVGLAAPQSGATTGGGTYADGTKESIF